LNFRLLSAGGAGISNADEAEWLRDGGEFPLEDGPADHAKINTVERQSPAAALFAPRRTLTIALQAAGTKAAFRAY
jgi:hypothetical protein